MRHLILLLFLVAFPFSVYADAVSVDPEDVCLVPDLYPCAPPVVSEARIHETTKGYDIDVAYPVLCEPAATRAIRDTVTNMVESFKAIDPDHDQTAFPHRYEMTGDYAVWPAAGGRIASVKLQLSQYTGGAHAMPAAVSWVFDLADGQTLELSDLFIDERTALREIAEMIRPVLRESLGDMFQPEMLEDGTMPTPDNYAVYILNEQGVAFFFLPYQVAPYAAGEQAVTLPFERIRHLLEPRLLAVLP